MPALRFLTVFFALFSFPAMACEPCIAKSSIERTVAQSSVIAIVVNNDQDASVESGNQPELLELTVERVLKGHVDTYAVLVHSWYGMCAYGAHMKLREKAVVLLQEVTDVATGAFDGTYKIVEDGCSQGQLDIKGGNVLVNERWMSLSTFENTYISR